MDLDTFPTSPAAQRMLGYVTAGWYNKSYVGKWIYQVMGEELDRIGIPVEELALQAFVNSATWGLKYWEELVGLPIQEDLDYLTRRALINEKINKYHPINPEWLGQFLSGITGREVEVTENPKTYTFSVKIGNGRNEYSLPLTIRRLDAAKPAHLAYDITLVYQDEINLQMGIATNTNSKKRPISEIDKPLLSMQYLVAQRVSIRPAIKELAELTGHNYLTDGKGHIFCDENKNLFYDDSE